MEQSRSYALTIDRNLVISCKVSDRWQIWTQRHKRRVVRNSGHCIILTACKSWRWKVVKSWNDYSVAAEGVFEFILGKLAALKTPFAELLRKSLLLRIQEQRNGKLVVLMKYLHGGKKYNNHAEKNLPALPANSSLIQHAKKMLSRLFNVSEDDGSSSLWAWRWTACCSPHSNNLWLKSLKQPSRLLKDGSYYYERRQGKISSKGVWCFWCNLLAHCEH